MGKEIERKFLVNGEFKHLAISKMEIIQAYLSIDRNRVIRVRIWDDNSVLSIKSPVKNSVLARNEWEIELPINTARELIEICLPGRINKTRYIIPFKDHYIEVDQFHGKNEGLIIAEVEVAFEEEEFDKPDWLGEEVTGRPEFYNCNLI